MILLDANILLRMADSLDAKHQATLRAVFKLRSTEQLVIAPQSLYEFAAVASRSKAVNGLGMDAAKLARWIARLQITFDMLPETGDLVSRWASLISTFNVIGFQVHDARYVALMQCHGLTNFMTYNPRHFARFPVTIIDPEKV